MKKVPLDIEVYRPVVVSVICTVNDDGYTEIVEVVCAEVKRLPTPDDIMGDMTFNEFDELGQRGKAAIKGEGHDVA